MIIIQDATILFVHWRNRSVKVLCKSMQVFASLCKSAKVRTSLFILQESKIIIQYPKILFDISSIRVWKCHASLCKSMHVYASLCNSEQISFFLCKSSDNHLRSDFPFDIILQAQCQSFSSHTLFLFWELFRISQPFKTESLLRLVLICL